MLSGNARCAENLLELGHVEPDDGNAQREYYGRKQKKVLCRFVKRGRVLEDGQVSSSDRH